MIGITWGTKVIFVPKSESTLIQASPEVRELDVDQFRLDLKDLEDSSNGMAFERTHNHNTEVVLSGITYARTVEIINGYTVEFEDGQYTVVLVGANNNIGDVKVANQVSLVTNNSAGLIKGDSGSADWTESERDLILDCLTEIKAYSKKASDNSEQANLKL